MLTSIKKKKKKKKKTFLDECKFFFLDGVI